MVVRWGTYFAEKDIGIIADECSFFVALFLSELALKDDFIILPFEVMGYWEQYFGIHNNNNVTLGPVKSLNIVIMP